MKSIWRFILTILLCQSLLGCDALYRILDKKGAEEKDLVGGAVPFEKNLRVEEIQNLLKIYGYNPGSIDGVLGLKTRNAIERFQKDTGLAPSRFVDKETWHKLTAFKEKGLVVGRDLNVKLVQQILEVAGFSPGTRDGQWGDKTQDAVKAFQKAHHLKADGKIGYATLTKMAEYISRE